jgi:hypothetical protein
MNIEKFKELKQKGFTNQQIADYFKVSLSVIKKFIKNNNLTTKKKEINHSKFIELYNEGKQDIEIAEILQIAKTRIITYRKSLGLKSQTDRLREQNQQKFIDLYNEGKTDSEIARILNVNNVTISNWRNILLNKSSNFKYSRKFDINKFLELYNAGLNYKEIAKTLNVSDSAIQNYASSLGLTPNTFNKDIPTYEQRQIIIGSLLGDMSLKLPKNAIHASGDFAHSLKQENYCKFLEDKLKNFCSKGFYKTQTDKRTNKQYQSYYVYMKASEYLTELYYKFYPKGIKIVPKDLLYSLDGLGIAIWYMDDGFKDCNTYRIATNCFNIDDLETIVEFFKIKYGIVCTIHSSHVIRISAKSAETFKNLIIEYIHQDCLYKI